MERNRITVNFNFKIPSGLIGDLGEFIAYRYLSQEFSENINEVGFLIPWSAKLVNLYYGHPHSLSSPYQVIHTLKSLSLAVKKDKVEFNPEYRTVWRRGQYFLVGKDGVEIPQEDNSYFESLLRSRPPGTNPDVSYDLLSFNQVIIDYQLNCEYLKTIQLIEVKAITKSTAVAFTYAEIKTLQHISSMNFGIDCSYQVLVVNLANSIQGEFQIYALDNQKILDASQNKSI